MTRHSLSVSVIFLQEGNGWVAQCLEYDIAAQGKSIPKAMDALEEVFVGQIVVDLAMNKHPLEDTPAAPPFYWDKQREAMQLRDRRPFYFGNNIPPAFMVRATAEDLRVAT